jgi:hypothetical protein
MYNSGYFSDEKHNYSIQMMFDYININKPSKIKLNMSELLFNLNWNSLKDDIKPIDILQDITNKKYKHEVERIKNADISYPIIIDSNYNIIDGVHRYMKHILDHKRKISVYIFNKSLMKKFMLH